jgi:hypothetical protein
MIYQTRGQKLKWATMILVKTKSWVEKDFQNFYWEVSGSEGFGEHLLIVGYNSNPHSSPGRLNLAHQ